MNYKIDFFEARKIEKKTNQMENTFQNLIDFQNFRKSNLVIDKFICFLSEY